MNSESKNIKSVKMFFFCVDCISSTNLQLAGSQIAIGKRGQVMICAYTEIFQYFDYSNNWELPENED